MASFTSNKGFAQPLVNGDVGVWGALLNNNMSILDNNLGGVATVNCAGSSNVTATTSQAQQLVQSLTGVLTGSINYILPAVGSFYIISNGTTGAFGVTVITSAGGSTGFVCPQGTTTLVYSDGTNVFSATSAYLTAASIGALLASPTVITAGMVGEVKAYAGGTIATGWHLCAGTALSRTTFAALFAAIGTAWGAGNGTTTFNIPDLRGRALFGLDNMGGSAANRITNAVSGIAGTTLGAAGGNQLAQKDTIAVGVTGAISLTGAVTVLDTGHAHIETYGQGSGSAQTAFNTTGQGSSTLTTADATSSATANITVINTMGISNGQTITATSELTGTSQNMPPTAMVNYIIYAAA